jgi:hypothetical protein
VLHPDPDTRFPLAAERVRPSDASASGSGAAVEAAYYTCPIQIDPQARWRKYSVDVTFETAGGPQKRSFERNFWVLVGYPPSAPDQKERHPIEIATDKEHVAHIVSGSVSAVPLKLFNGFDGYDITIKDIRVESAQGLFDCDKLLLKEDESVLPSGRWAKDFIQVPVRGSLFPLAAMANGFPKTPEALVTVHYSDAFHDDEIVRSAGVPFEFGYHWGWVGGAALLGTFAGVVAHRKFLRRSRAPFWTQFAINLLVALCVSILVYRFEIKLLVINDKPVLAYDNPVTAFAGCAVFGVLDLKNIIKQLVGLVK